MFTHGLWNNKYHLNMDTDTIICNVCPKCGRPDLKRVFIRERCDGHVVGTNRGIRNTGKCIGSGCNGCVFRRTNEVFFTKVN